MALWWRFLRCAVNQRGYECLMVNAKPGTIIHVQGSGFRSGEPAEIVIKPQSIPEFRVVEEGERLRVTPDENGEVDFEFMMPNINIPAVAVGSTPVRVIVRQSEASGALRVNEDLRLAGEAIIETIFLALMATAAGFGAGGSGQFHRRAQSDDDKPGHNCDLLRGAPDLERGALD